MNRRIKNMITGFIAACAISLAQPFGGLEALAASAKIAFSDPNTTVGQEFYVTVKVTASDGNLGAADLLLSYDENYIKFISGNNANGGAGSVRLIGTMDSSTTTEFSFSLKFKAVQAGDTSITVTDKEVYDMDTQAVNLTKVGASTVKVKAPATYSSEAALTSLKISPGQLTPAFSPDVLNYTVNVGRDVDKIAVSADVKDGKAKTTITGGSGLKTGSNTVICKVTAEDGRTVKSYTITVNKSESEEITELGDGAAAGGSGAAAGEMNVDIDGKVYSVATSFDPGLLPEGYTQSSCTYNGTEIMSGSGYGLNLIYLQDSEGNGSFFIYIPETGALSPYVTIETAAKSILVLPIDDTIEVPDGFVQTMIELSDADVKGWVWETDEENQYCVVYGMNENGEKGLYRYDRKEHTFQRYFEDPALKSRYDEAEVMNLLNKYNALCKEYDLRFIVIVVLIVICLLLFFMVINLLMKRREYADRPVREEAPTPVKRRAVQEEEAGMRQSRTYRADRETKERTPQRRQAATADDQKMPKRRDGADMTDTLRQVHTGGYPEFSADGRTSGRRQQQERRNPDLVQGGARRNGYQEAAILRMAGTLEPGYPEPGRMAAERPARSRIGFEEPRRERPEPGRYVRGNADGRNVNQGPPPYSRAGRELQDGSYRKPGFVGQSSTARGYSGNGQISGNRPPSGYFDGGTPEQVSARRGVSAARYTEPDRSAREHLNQDYTKRQVSDGIRRGGAAKQEPRNLDAGMEETIRLREQERAERARRSRERLERERLEDERRARIARYGQRDTGKNRLGDDDLEVFDLN